MIDLLTLIIKVMEPHNIPNLLELVAWHWVQCLSCWHCTNKMQVIRHCMQTHGDSTKMPQLSMKNSYRIDAWGNLKTVYRCNLQLHSEKGIKSCNTGHFAMPAS